MSVVRLLLGVNGFNWGGWSILRFIEYGGKVAAQISDFGIDHSWAQREGGHCYSTGRDGYGRCENAG